MVTAAVKDASYCLIHVPEIALRYGTTPRQERLSSPSSPFLLSLERAVGEPALSYERICRYAPHLAYIGALKAEDLERLPRPFLENMFPEAKRYGAYGEIMPENEFIGLMDICDVFDLVWLERSFAASVKARLAEHPLMAGERLARLESGRPAGEIAAEVEKGHALPLYFAGAVAGCCRKAHETDENLSAHVVLENVAGKAGAVLALLHLIRNAGLSPADVDFVIDCSEEAVGDINQRGGGNMAKAIAESAGCPSASGFDLRAFCAAPTAAIISAASMVSAGVHKNVAVVSGGSVPKLFMNSREHVKKGVPPMENVLGCFAALLAPGEEGDVVIRLDGVGKHGVGAGASPQAVTTALVFEPLRSMGLKLTDVDKYAPELHDPEVTIPAGAGNVPEANFKMIAALATMKGQCEKADMAEFARSRGMRGFAPIQGHIPSGVPYLGHAVEAIRKDSIKRAMIIGKGSLFLGRLTNLADGASFVVEKAAKAAKEEGVARRDVEAAILEVLEEIAGRLKG
jgi:betaine reductase